MLKVNLRDFANLKLEEAYRWRGIRRKAEVTDDFGEKTLSDTYALMLTWVGLIVHRHYDHIKYSVKQLVPSTVDRKDDIVYNDDALAKPVNYTLKQVMPGIIDPAESDKIKRLVHIWQNKLNNLITVLSEEYIISARAEDVSDLMHDEGVMKITEDVRSGKLSIIDGEGVFADYVKTAPSLDHNTMALLTRTGGVSVNQAYQTVVLRGNVFDLNNNILPNTIYDCYAGGVKNLADNIADSRTSGMSLVANGKGLSDSQWFHRKTHQHTAVMRGITKETDCGTKGVVSITVSGKQMARALLGKNAVLEDGTIQIIDEAFIKKVKAGDEINVRSVAFCETKDVGRPCGTCFGKMFLHLPYNTIMEAFCNVGMYSSTSVCNPLGQGMLSTKHLIRSAETVMYTVNKADEYILSTNGDDIFLKKEMVRSGTKIILQSNISRELSDLRSLDILDENSIEKLPSFQTVVFEYEVEDIMIGGVSNQRHSCNTAASSRHAKFSLGFLEYVLEKGWEEEDRRFISVNLDEWNYKEPMFSLPYTREDLDHHRQKVENFLTFNQRNRAWKSQVVTPKIFGDTLVEFWTLLNQEIKGLNIVYLEVMLACCLTTDPENNSYGLALGNQDKYFTSFVACVENRGSGTLMIFERIRNYLATPKSFLVKDRQPSPMEVFFQNGVS